MNSKQKKTLIRIIITALLMVGLHFVPAEGFLRFLLYMIPYLIVGYDIIIKAWKGIKNRQPLDECFLMVVATIGAIAIALLDTGDYVEAVAVMLFYQIGEWFQSYAIGKSRKSITELMDIRPDYANMEVDGELTRVDPDEVEVGSIIICQPGEKVPIDGVVVSGSSTLDTSALTGESLPREIHEGEEIISGTINMSGVLSIRTTKEFGESTVSTILDMVENASSRKSKAEDFISKFARVYTPVVVGLALALAILPPLVRLLALGVSPGWGTWIYRALTFLVISCPCALVISIPLTFFAGIGGASNAGVLIKGSNYIESLAKTNVLVCDKTGTLTKGVFQVVGVHHASISEDKILEYAAHAECASSHPISKSLQAAYMGGEVMPHGVCGAVMDAADGMEASISDAEGTMATREIDRSRVSDIEEISGEGISAVIDGHKVLVGNDKLMTHDVISFIECHDIGTVIHVAVDGEYVGHILISDVIKDTTPKAIEEIKRSGVSRIVMLTGDDDKVAYSVASTLGIAEFHSELLPGDKVTIVEKLLSENHRGALAFVGDGINDAPVLARADIGIAMGAMGSDAAIEAADVVLMDDDPVKISKAVRIAKKCMRIAYENIYFAIGVKIACLVLGALGLANMWLAIFADVGVMVIAVLNAIRALFVKNL
ncbi:MAG: heavy metal translocating P-type ATPase [Firmicutes bacterium]|nr:heavy metal translocating P-type ATPase [Bacillota bacterium]